MNSLSKWVAENIPRVIDTPLDEFFRRNSSNEIYVEEKIDGRLVVLFITSNRTLLATRHNGVYGKESYPELFNEVENLHLQDTVLLGELIHATQVLYLYDVLYWNGRDVRDELYIQRRSYLSNIKESAHIKIIPTRRVFSIEEAWSFFEEIVRRGGEGIVLKVNGRFYRPNSWCKVKKFRTFDVVIKEIKETEGYRRTGIPMSWDICVHVASGEFYDVGSVSSCIAGVDREKIKPGTVVEVRAQEVTKDYKLRHPVIIRIRDDKKPEECSLEQLVRGVSNRA